MRRANRDSTAGLSRIASIGQSIQAPRNCFLPGSVHPPNADADRVRTTAHRFNQGAKRQKTKSVGLYGVTIHGTFISLTKRKEQTMGLKDDLKKAGEHIKDAGKHLTDAGEKVGEKIKDGAREAAH